MILAVLGRRWHFSSGSLYLAQDLPEGWSGLTAGGLRIDPSARPEDAERLAELMTLKLAVCHVPVRGAKAVAVPHPGADRDRLLVEVAEALRPHLATDYLLGEDLGTTSADVVTVYQAAGVDPVAMVATYHAERGTPLDLPEGLSLADLMNDEFAGVLAGEGAVVALTTALGDEPLAGQAAAIQGFGTVGLAVARALVRGGARVVTLVDEHGYVHHPDGLPVDDLAHAGHGRIDRTAAPDGALTGPAEDWLGLPADVLVPAAVAGAITAADVPLINPAVHFVVEGANDPVTRDGEEALEAREIRVLPDFVANAGSAVAFGLLASGEATVADVGERYLERISDAVRRCLARGEGFRAAAEAEAADFLAGRLEHA